jgi:hypothetical protein
MAAMLEADLGPELLVHIDDLLLFLVEAHPPPRTQSCSSPVEPRVPHGSSSFPSPIAGTKADQTVVAAVSLDPLS